MASAVAYDRHVKQREYFNCGTKHTRDIYSDAIRQLGSKATLVMDAFLKINSLFELFQAIQGCSATRTCSAAIRKPQRDDLCEDHTRYIHRFVHHLNRLAGYSEGAAMVNNACALWGIQANTVSATFISDTALVLLLPCVDMHKDTSKRYAGYSCNGVYQHASRMYHSHVMHRMQHTSQHLADAISEAH